MKKKVLLYLLIVSSALGTFYSANAQHDPIYTQYMFNMLPVNPAYAGSRDVISMTALYRKQWINVAGAPRTLAFSADAPLKRKHIGLGVNIINDRIGVFDNTTLMAVFAYRIHLRKSILSFGMQGGITQVSALFGNVRTNDAGTITDGAFSQNLVLVQPNIGVGVYYTSDKFYMGLSIPHILNNQLHSAVSSFNVDRKPAYLSQFFLIAGYIFRLNQEMVLKPSTLWKYVYGAPIQFDLNCNLWIYDKVAVGLSYRSMTALSVLLELQVTNEIRIGYAYDWTFTRLKNFTYGGHEIMLRYEFGHNKVKVITPRYF